MTNNVSKSEESRRDAVLPPVDVIEDATGITLYADLPGVSKEQLNLRVEADTLTIEGERASGLPAAEEKAAVHINERFAGRFRRAISLPEDIDPSKVEATYRDGVLRVSVARRESALPRRITVQ